jgi:5-methylcytosine-specific restriction endonuclease McrA
VGVCVATCGAIHDAIGNAAEKVYNRIFNNKASQAPGSRPGKPFTPKGKQIVKDGNAAAHGGVPTCEKCGTETTPGQQGQKGVTPPGTQTEVDHKDPKSNGGSGTPENGEVLCRDCNQAKGSTVPEQRPIQPQPQP